MTVRVLSCQASRRRSAVGRAVVALRLPCLQPGQWGALDGASTAPDTCPPWSHASRQRQQPPQARWHAHRAAHPWAAAPADALAAAPRASPPARHGERPTPPAPATTALAVAWCATPARAHAAPRCLQRDRGHTALHGRLAVCLEPSGPLPVRAHDARRGVVARAPPQARCNPRALDPRHHRLPSGRDVRTALLASAARVQGLARADAWACRPERTPTRRSVQLWSAPATARRSGTREAEPAALSSGVPSCRSRTTGLRGCAPCQTASRAVAHSPSASGQAGRGPPETSPCVARKARGARDALGPSPTSNRPCRPRRAGTRRRQGPERGSSARAPATTSGARGMPTGARTACLTLPCGRAGRASVLGPHGTRPCSRTGVEPLALVLSTCTRAGGRS